MSSESSFTNHSIASSLLSTTLSIANSTLTTSSASRSHPISRTEAYLLRSFSKPVIADKSMLIEHFNQYKLLNNSYSVFKINELITDSNKKQSSSSFLKNIQTEQFKLVNRLSDVYLKNPIKKPQLKFENSSNGVSNSKPIRPATPPGPLFKKTLERSNRKTIIIRSNKLPPPPPKLIKRVDSTSTQTTESKFQNKSSKSVIVEGILPNGELRRHLLTKPDPKKPNSLLLTWNMPNITFKFRIEV